MAEETLRTLDRALEVLRAFGRGSPEPTVAQVAERVAMPRSVVVRILATLERAGFVEHASGNSRKFRIGLDACEVGTLYFAGNPLLRGSEDVLHDIAERTGFTAYLAISARSTARRSSSGRCAKAARRCASSGTPATGCRSPPPRGPGPADSAGLGTGRARLARPFAGARPAAARDGPPLRRGMVRNVRTRRDEGDGPA